MKISWLHISDLHIFPPKSKGAGEQHEQDTVLNRFLQYIQNELPSSVQKPQFIFVTGDLAFGGKDTDYFGPSPLDGKGRPVIEFLQKLANHLGIPDDRVAQSVFTVPGNHDIDRDKLAIRSIESGYLKILEDPKEVTKFILEEDLTRSAVLSRLKNYVDFWKKLRGKDVSVEECLWYTERPELDDGTTPLAIVGLCSAWLSGSCWKVMLEPTPGHENNEEDTKYLALCEKKVADLLDKTTGADINIALMHHDYQTLNELDRQRSGSLLEQQCEFVLCGHRHKPDLMPRRLGAKTHIVQAGASYESRDLRNTFNMVEVNLDTRLARMIIVEYHKDKWQIDRTAFKLNNQDKAFGYELSDDGVLSFPLDSIEGPDKEPPGHSSSKASPQGTKATKGGDDSGYISSEREDPKVTYSAIVSGWDPFGQIPVVEDSTLQRDFMEPQVFYSRPMKQAIGDMMAIQPDFFKKKEFNSEVFVLSITQRPFDHYSGLITRKTTIRKDVGLGHDAVIARFDTIRTFCEIVPFNQIDSTNHHSIEKLSLLPIHTAKEVEHFYVEPEAVKIQLDEGRIGRDRSFVIFDVHGSGKTSLLANLCVDATKHRFQPLWVILPDGPVTTDLAKELMDYTRNAKPANPVLVVDAVERCPSVLENCGNPAVGRLFDALIAAGGSAIFSETTEVIGAEHILSKRAKNEVVKQKLLEAVNNTEEKAKNTGEDIRATNPIPENIAGGLTTLEEKSLGAIVKSGTSPIEDVIQYAERITHPGLYFMDAWMSSLSLPTGYAASGAQLLYQMGGQGIPGREFPAPAVSSGVVIPIMYLTGNSNTFVRAKDTIDFNSGTVLEDLESMDDVSERLINWVIKVASGAKTKAETINFDDPIELYLHGPVL